MLKGKTTKKGQDEKKTTKEKPFASLKSTASDIKERHKRNQAALRELDN